MKRTGEPGQLGSRPTDGFTLLEIVIVLVVIVVIASITWPSLMQYLRRQQLSEGVADVRGEMGKTRLKAIDNALVYQFRYEPGGRWYAVLPYDRPDSGNAQRISGGGSNGSAQRAVPSIVRQLPVTLHFVSQGPTEQLSKEWMALLPQAAGVGGVAWSPAILFQVDGTADSATVIVQDANNFSQTLTVRGLTGAVSAGPLQLGATQ